MNKQEFAKAIEELKCLDEEFNQHNNKLKQLFGNDSSAENVFLDMHYRARGMAIKYLSILVEDNNNWIEWWLEFGRSTWWTVISDVKMQCYTAEDLWDIIKKFNKAEQQ